VTGIRESGEAPLSCLMSLSGLEGVCTHVWETMIKVEVRTPYR